MDWTLLIIATPTALLGVLSLYLIWREQHSTSNQILKKGRESMLTDTRSWSPIETGNWGTLSPKYFFRFNGPGDLYCMGCAHDIRLVCRTKTGVRCLDCGQALAIAIP